VAGILIVEDSPELAENLCEIIESQGHTVVLAHTAEEALLACEQRQFEGILTDLKLPGKSGVDLIGQLRDRQDSTPIVLMTAFADAQAKEAAERLGALAVVFKPLDLDKLFRLVNEFSRENEWILVLEDNADLAHNLRDALLSSGFHPVVAGSVREALEQQHLPSVAVVDYRLPDGTGLEAAYRLWARDPGLRVILISGYAEDIGARLGAGPPAFVKRTLLKPVPVARLLVEVRAEHLARRLPRGASPEGEPPSPL
jgi:CheY-like chemotaxis protein